MNLTLWVWGHWGIAIAASILLGVNLSVAVTMTTQLSQRVSQQSGGNAAAAQRGFG
jgi:hypothetical protein